MIIKVFQMKLTQKHKLKHVVFLISFLTSLWVLPLPKISKFSTFYDMIGIQTASATTRYGILGKPAPALKLNTWIDGNGKKTKPIRLKDYRGKIVYLYFFQDW